MTTEWTLHCSRPGDLAGVALAAARDDARVHELSRPGLRAVGWPALRRVAGPPRGDLRALLLAARESAARLGLPRGPFVRAAVRPGPDNGLREAAVG